MFPEGIVNWILFEWKIICWKLTVYHWAKYSRKPLEKEEKINIYAWKWDLICLHDEDYEQWATNRQIRYQMSTIFFYLHEVMGKAVHLESEKIQRCKIKIMGDSETTCICQLTSKYSVCNLYANAFTFNLILMTKFERAWK